MASQLLEHVDALEANASAYHGYRDRPIPHPLETAVDAVVRAYLAATEEDRAIATSTMPIGLRRILAAYAERAAMRAVRDDSAEPLHRGCTAIMAAISDPPEREPLMSLSLLHRSADLLEISFAEVLLPAATLAGEVATQVARNWITRMPDQRTIADMGFRESTDDNGRFYYAWVG